MRRTHVNLMRQAGVDRLVIRATTGHADDDLVDHYSRLDRGEQQAAVVSLMETFREA